jgi:hypothetical protein
MFVALPSASAKGVCWIGMGASGRNWIEGSGHYQIRHINTSILKKLLDVSYLVIGNKVASLTNLHQYLQEHSICISYMALKGINTPSLYIDQEDTKKNNNNHKYFKSTITSQV